MFSANDAVYKGMLKKQFSKQNHHPAYRHAENIYDGGTDTDDDECPLESSTTMNPYEYETTLDCRDDTRTIGGGGGGGVMIGGISGPITPRHPHGSQQNTLHHQNQQNFQLQQQPQQQQQQQQQQQDAQSSTYYDYEYQHLPHRASDLNPTALTATPSAASTAARTHGRQGKCYQSLSLQIFEEFFSHLEELF
uniref:Uncharacterized protein n=1 Tax=Glossina morsitans morsitans TaxID=37546 RepID=A0A1B0G335_GLOMM